MENFQIVYVVPSKCRGTNGESNGIAYVSCQWQRKRPKLVRTGQKNGSASHGYTMIARQLTLHN